MIVGVVLAAGAGVRFGAAPKQLAPLDGRPLIEHPIRALAAVADVDRVVVTLGAHADEIVAAADLRPAQVVRVPDWETGQAASLRAVARGLDASARALVVVLGDQPFLAPAAIARVIAHDDPGAAAVRASYNGRPGHPVLLRPPLFAALAELEGDHGARALLSGVAVASVACDGLGSPLDVDTTEELERASRRE